MGNISDSCNLFLISMKDALKASLTLNNFLQNMVHTFKLPWMDDFRVSIQGTIIRQSPLQNFETCLVAENKL